MNPPVSAPEAVDEQMIARVLGRAHQAAMATSAPAEARTVLELAQSFADEMATVDSEFDRRGFLEAIMEDRA
jgi:hypothetical protein